VKRAALAAVSLLLACCNANDVVLYGAAAAGAANETGDGTGGTTSMPETGGTDASGGSGATGGTDATGGADASGGTDTSGGTSATGGTDASGGMSATGGMSAAGGSGNVLGSAGTDALTPCLSNDDCYPTDYCSKTSCADTEGVCVPAPVFCDVKPATVCGCDNVTYWNSCVRAGYGVAADRPGDCGPMGARPPCMSDEDCGAPGLTCAHLLRSGSMTCTNPGGTCWGIPPDCEGNDMDPRRWVPCDYVGGPLTDAECFSTCDAIYSGGVYVPAPRGACP